MIKEYLNSKTQKEKIILGSLAAFIVLCLMIFGIWLPIHDRKVELANEAIEQSELLAWMNQKAPLLKNLQGNMPSQNNEDVFSIVEEKFKNQSSSNNLSIVRISETKASITFNEVPFDQLINQLLTLKKEFNIDVDEIQINKLQKPGLVEGKVILSKSK